VQGSQEPFQFQQFGIVRIFEPGLNGNSIIDLVSKGMWTVIDQDGLVQVTTQNIQILQKVSFDRET